MIFGTKEKILKGKKANVEKCETCECTELMVKPVVRYSHTMQMPLFINRKESVVVCTNCETSTCTTNFDNAEELHELAFEGEVLWSYYIGVFVIAMLIITYMILL